jgi:hypothetical protein
MDHAFHFMMVLEAVQACRDAPRLLHAARRI